MAQSPESILFIIMLALSLHLQMLYATQDDSTTFPDILQNSSFRSLVTIDGDAKASNDSSFIQLTQPQVLSWGQVTYKEPVDFEAGQGFSTFFYFSVSAENGGNLALLISPNGNQSVVAVNFNLTKDWQEVGINVGRLISVVSRNFSSGDGKNDSNFHAWIDYQASYKTLEVRLSDDNNRKPLAPLVAYPIDLSQMWKNTTAELTLTSSNADASQSCFLYSWRFKRNMAPRWMHSEPADPTRRGANRDQMEKNCFTKSMAALFFGIATGAGGALAMVYACSLFTNRRLAVTVAPQDYPSDFKKATF